MGAQTSEWEAVSLEYTRRVPLSVGRAGSRLRCSKDARSQAGRLTGHVFDLDTLHSHFTPIANARVTSSTRQYSPWSFVSSCLCAFVFPSPHPHRGRASANPTPAPIS